MCSTSAMSLLYECINTVIAVLISISSGIPNHTASIQVYADYDYICQTFLLKYLEMLAFNVWMFISAVRSEVKNSY
jgi:hypothetical protein